MLLSPPRAIHSLLRILQQHCGDAARTLASVTASHIADVPSFRRNAADMPVFAHRYVRRLYRVTNAACSNDNARSTGRRYVLRVIVTRATSLWHLCVAHTSAVWWQYGPTRRSPLLLRTGARVQRQLSRRATHDCRACSRTVWRGTATPLSVQLPTFNATSERRTRLALARRLAADNAAPLRGYLRTPRSA